MESARLRASGQWSREHFDRLKAKLVDAYGGAEQMREHLGAMLCLTHFAEPSWLTEEEITDHDDPRHGLKPFRPPASE